MISQRWAKANNPPLDGYDQAKPESYIIYLDANYLYGWAMIQAFNYEEFEWVPPEHVTETCIKPLPDDTEEGYILEVDLYYPARLHDLHKEYSLGQERVKISKEMLSPNALEMMQSLQMHHYASS